MRSTFERSEQTRKLIATFRSMSIGEAVTMIAITKALGFDVTAASSYSARQIVEKEHAIFIFIDGERGFVRGSGASMVASGAGFLQAIRSKAKRCSRRMETALTQNLTRDEHLVAAETLSRSNIIANTSSPVRIRSNRPVVDAGDPAGSFDAAAAIRAAR